MVMVVMVMVMVVVVVVMVVVVFALTRILFASFWAHPFDRSQQLMTTIPG